MADPLTLSALGVVTAKFVGYSVGSHFIGGEVHERLHETCKHWLENAVRESLPHNHHLHEASERSLRAALEILIFELAGRTAPEKSWLTRWREKLNHLAAGLPAGEALSADLFPGTTDPHLRWLEALRHALRGKSFAHLHDSFKLDEARLRQCFDEGDVCQALGPGLADAVLDWTRCNVSDGILHPDFDALVREGWNVSNSDAATTTAAPLSEGLAAKGVALQPPPARRITLAQAYCLCFREHLKASPEVFRIFTTDTLGVIRHKLDALGDQLTSDLKSLRDTVDSLAKNPPGFGTFEAWLTPQLGAIQTLLTEVKADLDKLARSHDELKRQQGDILVAITTLRTELTRGNTIAQAPLTELTACLNRFEHKLDYLLAGLPIRPFQLPEPPTHELQLLQAKHRTVELMGRDSDLLDLCGWLESGEPISARLVVGGAGTGKTRLAYELLLRVDAALPGWQAGVVTGEALRKFDATRQPADWRWPQPTLLVVDYAQTLAAPLAELLRALAHQRRAGLPPLRLLLLERQPGDWFEKLLREEDGSGPCPVRSLFHPPAPVPLTPLPKGEIRRRILSGTLAKSATITHKPAPPLPAQGQDRAFDTSLARDLFDQPLNLMMAALVAGDMGLLPALRRERTDLAEDLARKELRRVERFAHDHRNEAQKRLLRHLTACATLERGFTAEELERAVNEESAALKLRWPDGAGDLAARLRQALPGERLPVAPVEPDFVGEAVVLLELAQPDSPGGPDHWRSWHATVLRACRRDARAAPATLLHAFQNFGMRPQHGEALLAATDALIQAGLADAEPDLLLGLEDALPHQTVELRRRAAEITRQLYFRLKADMERGRDDLKPEVARLANNLGGRLSEAGRRAEALAPAQEAVDLYRALAAQNRGAFTPALAMSLNNLEAFLSGLGRRAEALAPAQEAVDLYRALVAQNPDAFTPTLAMSLNNLANRLSGLGRRAEALAPAQEAVDLFRALTTQNPGTFTPDLARSLNNLAAFLSGLGRRAEALALAQEAVDLLRALAAQNPDAFTPALASSLNNLSTFLSELGRRAEALVPAQEAVDLYRALVAQNLDAFTPALAMSLNTLANRLSGLGRRAEALAPAQEAVDLRRAQAAQNPDAFMPALASSLNNLATFLSELGRRAEALAPAQEAVDLLRAPTAQNPDAFSPDLASSLNNLANRLSELGQRAEALAPAQETVDIYRALVAQNLDAFAPDLASSLNNMANVLSGLGRRAEALAPAQEAVDLRRAQAAQNPDAFTPALASSLGMMGQTLKGNDRQKEALASFSEGIRVLTPQFKALTAAHAPLMMLLASEYLSLAKDLNRPPDEALLGPVLEVFQRMKGDADPST